MSRSILALLVAILSLQTGAALAKQLFPLVGPEGMTALRIFFAAVILVFFFRPWKISYSKKALKNIFVYGVSLGLMNLFFYKALERIPQGITVALEFVGPLGLSLLLSRRWTDLLWATLAILGVILLLPLERTQANLDPLGVAFALMAGLCWAFYIFFGQRVGSTLGTSAVAVGMCIACMVTFPLGVLKHGSSLFSFQVIPLALGIALLSSVIPYSLELSALKKIPAKTFGIFMSLEPVVATLVAYILAKEKVKLLEIIAIVFITIASVGASLCRKKTIKFSEL